MTPKIVSGVLLCLTPDMNFEAEADEKPLQLVTPAPIKCRINSTGSLKVFVSAGYPRRREPHGNHDFRVFPRFR